MLSLSTNLSKKVSTQDLLYSAIFTALTAALSYVIIPLPFSPVPITGQTFAIMLCGAVLTTKQTFFSVLSYILIGLVGVPVFSGGTAGPGVVFGAKAGYIWGFLIGALVISLLAPKAKNWPAMAIACFSGGVVVVYLLGILWLARFTGMTVSQAFSVGALPFIPGDIFKVLVASFVALKLRRMLKK